MNSLKLICLIVLLGSFSANCQDIAETSKKQKLSRHQFHQGKLALKVEYFGELVLHPGLSIGLDYTVVRNDWVTVHWDVDFGGYWHRWNHTALFIKSTIGARFAAGPVFADINIGIGYMHSFSDGTIYKRAPEGGVEKATNWGYAHFMPNVSLLLGWDGSRKNNLPWTIYLGPEFYLQSSYNHIFLPHLAVKVGLTYKFL